MYLKFYNLTKEPFHITPDPQFLYLGESHKQALASMVYGIEKRKGFVAITGGVGTGKTTVVRAYLDRAKSADLKVIYLFQANMTFKEFVRIIYQEFDLELTTSNLVDMVNGLHLALIEYYRQGKTVVVIIDEAQNMPVETLENLRMLSNLETPTEKLMQIVLVGQAELEELLEKHELRQLKQRIAIRSRIAPLNAQESYAYIEHRLSVAGLDKPTIFSKKALDIIVKEANGVPRLLNVLCDNALITGFGYEKNPVTARIAQEVVNDFATKQRRPPVRKWKVAALVGVAVVLAFVIAFSLSPYRHGVVQMLADAGSGQATKPEPVRSPVSGPPVAAEPKTAIKPESAIRPIRIEEGVVKKVVDGDTVNVTTDEGRKLKIRLWGIYAPETKKVDRKTGVVSKPGQPYGDQAEKALMEKVLGKKVRVAIMNIDRYRRSASILYLGDEDINRQMAKEGYAWAHREYLHGLYTSEYIDAENEARAKKLGLWQQANPLPPWEFRRRLRNR